MKAEDILLALGEIDETLPPKCTKPVEKKTNEPPAPKPAPIPIETAKKKQNRRKIAGAFAACFALVFVAAFLMTGSPAPDNTPQKSESVTEWFTEEQTMEEHSVAPAYNGESNPARTQSKKVTPTAPAQTTPQQKGCNHDWIVSSKPCVEAPVCSKCGMTKPNSLTPHNWAPANCHDPKTCRACGKTEGSINPNNHVYVKTNGGYFCKYCGEENPNKSEGVTVENRPTSTTEPMKETTTSFGFTLPIGKPLTTKAPSESSTTGTSWESRSVAEKYPEMTFNEKRYVFGSDDAQEPGAHLGALTLAGSDGDPAHALRAEIYAIPDTAPESAVLVRFPDGSFYRYNAA